MPNRTANMPLRTVYDIEIDFEKSKGSFVYDKKLKVKYLDFLNMFSSLPLGYNHPIFDISYEKKILSVSKLRMANNLFISSELIDFKRRFMKYLKYPHLHFTSTGALAVEAGMKVALYKKKSKEPIFWALDKAFHGINSWGFLTDSYGPTEPRINWYPKNKWENLPLDKMIEILSNNSEPKELTGIVIEPILCTSGDIYLPKDNLVKLKNLCKKKNISFIVDEIQTGFGPAGEMWYSDRIGLDYDILIFGKKSQIMGINASDDYRDAFESDYRILEVTFDGDLIDAIRADYILQAYEKDNLLMKAKKRESEIQSLLGTILDNFRATGNLWAFDFDSSKDRDTFCSNCFDQKLLVNKGGLNSVRMRPNLAVSDDEVEEMYKIIKNII
jgi:L-lysine 6-transaminase